MGLMRNAYKDFDGKYKGKIPLGVASSIDCRIILERISQK